MRVAGTQVGEQGQARQRRVGLPVGAFARADLVARAMRGEVRISLDGRSVVVAGDRGVPSAVAVLVPGQPVERPLDGQLAGGAGPGEPRAIGPVGLDAGAVDLGDLGGRPNGGSLAECGQAGPCEVGGRPVGVTCSSASGPLVVDCPSSVLRCPLFAGDSDVPAALVAAGTGPGSSLHRAVGRGGGRRRAARRPGTGRSTRPQADIVAEGSVRCAHARWIDPGPLRSGRASSGSAAGRGPTAVVRSSSALSAGAGTGGDGGRPAGDGSDSGRGPGRGGSAPESRRARHRRGHQNGRTGLRR